MANPETLIVGQGIAGTVLARLLEKAGESFLMIDGNLPSASRAAAGVWNPIAVKRFLKAWLADESVASSQAFFQKEEAFFNSQFFFETGLIKLMSNDEERKQMEQRFDDLNPFVIADETTEPAPGVDAPYGVLHIKTAGYVDVSAYLDACAGQWMATDSLVKTEFKHDDLLPTEQGWEWQGQCFKRVIFCEGISGRNNPWMKHLPLNNTKGQVLRLEIPDLEIQQILNKNLFILPQGNQEFRIGSTYEWNFDDLEPTEEGKVKLLEMLVKILPNKNYRVMSQEAGGRPTTRDRRPLMGALDAPGLYVFNGMGSRGVILVPYLAECMLRYLNGDESAIPEEGRLQRFKKKENLSR